MPLPRDSTVQGTHGGDTGDHPDGTPLFQGHKTDVVAAGANFGIRITVVNVFGKKHEGSQVYCVEKVVTKPDSTVTRTHSWKTSQQYESSHQQMWRNFDMEPNRDFNIGAGIRSEGGEHLDGGNELCERDGKLKKANVEAKCR